MGQYFLIANLHRKEFVDPANFVENQSRKLHHICQSSMAGVLIFLTSSSDYYDFMGLWATDRILVIGDETSEYTDLFLKIRDEWKDITREVAESYFRFVFESG